MPPSSSPCARAKGFDSFQTQGSQAHQVVFHRPVEGETGMFALHLRFDQDALASTEA